MRCGYGRATSTFDSDNDAAPARINKRLTLLIGMMRPVAVPNEEAECTSLCKCEKKILRLEWQCSSGTEEGSALLGPAESLLGTLGSMSRDASSYLQHNALASCENHSFRCLCRYSDFPRSNGVLKIQQPLHASLTGRGLD